MDVNSNEKRNRKQQKTVSAEPVNFTQVPQEELKDLGTGMITAG